MLWNEFSEGPCTGDFLSVTISDEVCFQKLKYLLSVQVFAIITFKFFNCLHVAALLEFCFALFSVMFPLFYRDLERSEQNIQR